MDAAPLSQESLVRRCLVVSVFDGSLIDLTQRPRQTKMKKTFTTQPVDSLGKRNFQVFDYIEKNYLDHFRNLPEKDKADSNESKMSALVLRENLNLNYQNTRKKMISFKDNRLRQSSNLKREKFKLEKIRAHPLVVRKPSALSPLGMVSTLSFHSNPKTNRMFFPGFLKSQNSKLNYSLFKFGKFDEKNQRSFLPNRLTPKISFLQKEKNKKICQKNYSWISENFHSIMQMIVNMYSTRAEKTKFEIELCQFKKMLTYLRLKASPLTNFHNLICKFLKGDTLNPSDLLLTDLEIILFCIFLVKKRFKKIHHLKWSAESMNAVRECGVNKRSEQNYKIILKRFMKKVIRNFNQKKGNSAKNDAYFYKYHFKAIADSMDYDWRKLRFENVFNETRVDYSVQTRRQSKKFFARILKKSSAFMGLMNEYLDNELMLDGQRCGIVMDYLPIQMSKANLLTDKWRTSINAMASVQEALGDFVAKQLLNNKVKLPWSLVEIGQGIETVRRLFQRAE